MEAMAEVVEEVEIVVIALIHSPSASIAGENIQVQIHAGHSQLMQIKLQHGLKPGGISRRKPDGVGRTMQLSSGSQEQ